MRRSLLSILAIFSLLLVGCGSPGQDSPNPSVGGTQTGNPPSDQLLFLAFHSSDLNGGAEAVKGLPSPSGGEEVAEALIVVRDIDIEEAEGCPPMSFPTVPAIIDLVGQLSGDEPQGESGSAASSDDCHPTMAATFGPLEATDDAASGVNGARMVGRSFLVRVVGARDVPIEFRTDQGWSASVVNPERWMEEGSNLIVGFDLDVWFEGIGLDDERFPKESEGGETIVVVDRSGFPDVLDRLIANKRESMGLYLDANGNGELDRDEYLDPIPYQP